MAKAGFVLHGARGKVGNLVARKGDNKTILAEYQPVVKNPQTNAQMATRIILSTVSQAVPLLYPIIDHSFEGFAVGSKCTREFRRLNMNLLRQYAAQDFRDTPAAVDATVFMTTKGVKALIPNKYQISSGSLSPSKAKVERVDVGLSVILPDVNFSATKSGNNYTFKLGDVLQGLFGITTPGEQLTLVIIQNAGSGYKYAFNGDYTMPGWVIPYTSMRAARLVVGADVDFNQEITVDLTQGASNLDEFMNKVSAAFAASPRTDASLLKWFEDWINAEGFTLAPVGNNAVSFTYDTTAPLIINRWSKNPDSNEGHAYAAGLIRSKLMDNGKWAYSNSFMVLEQIAVQDDENYGLDWNSAIQAWFEKDAITDNSLFLKEGATANELGESFT